MNLYAANRTAPWKARAWARVTTDRSGRSSYRHNGRSWVFGIQWTPSPLPSFRLHLGPHCWAWQATRHEPRKA
jgi:hypothetical protein